MLWRAVVFSVFIAAPWGVMAQDADCSNQLTTADMRYCANQEYTAADRDLNADYKRAIQALRELDKVLPAELAGGEETLRNAQRAWITYRDLACEAQGYSFRGGTMEPVIVTHCLADLTRERSEQLRLIWEMNE